MDRPKVEWNDVVDAWQCIAYGVEMWSDDRAEIEAVLDGMEESRLRRNDSREIWGACLFFLVLIVGGSLLAHLWWG
jgi:hypothetical protein